MRYARMRRPTCILLATVVPCVDVFMLVNVRLLDANTIQCSDFYIDENKSDINIFFLHTSSARIVSHRS